MADISVAIVEDQKATRDGLARLVGRSTGYRLAGAFGSMEEALPALARAPVDVVLSDIGLPGMSGIAGIRQIKLDSPATQILILTVYDDNDHVFEAVCAGASGYLVKDTPPDRVREAMRELSAGGAPMSPEIAHKVLSMFQRLAPPREEPVQLSPRELELLRLLADGHSYKTAANELSLSMDTIRFHIRNIYAKLHVHSKSEAVLKAFRTGVLR
jgi:DNA-binding NarL/FixJ family response regulator